MKKMSTVKKSIFTAVCVALCIVLPMAFHGIANAGSILLPMHIPVLLCGMICGWPFGLICGLLGPLLSSLITGMPPAAYLPGMMIELAVYGLITGFLMEYIHTGKLAVDSYISLISAMVVGRIVAGGAKALLFASGQYSVAAWVTGYFITGLPGIIIQLVLVPAVYFALEKSRMIPLRYEDTPNA